MSTQKELFSLHSNIRLLSVSIYSVFYVGRVAECSCVRSCLSLCPGVALTQLLCCVNTNFSLTNLTPQSSVPMRCQSSLVSFLTHCFMFPQSRWSLTGWALCSSTVPEATRRTSLESELQSKGLKVNPTWFWTVLARRATGTSLWSLTSRGTIQAWWGHLWMKDSLPLTHRGLQPPPCFIIRNTLRFWDLMTRRVITWTESFLHRPLQSLNQDTPTFLLMWTNPGSPCLRRAWRSIRVRWLRLRHLLQVDTSQEGPQTQWIQTPSYL